MVCTTPFAAFALAGDQVVGQAAHIEYERYGKKLPRTPFRSRTASHVVS